MTQFEDLRLIEPLLQAVRAEGYTEPTPIQQQAIGYLLEGKDLLGCAQTGTGKTAAFALPILQRLSAAGIPEVKGRRPIRALVITPTRELAAQIDESFAAYGRNLPLRHTVIYGGVRQGPQSQALKKGVDILVATPGRLLDLMGQRLVHLDKIEVFVLDEADRMLDMGFIDDVRKIIRSLPAKRQTLMFSATMPQKIQYLADSILTDPVEVRVASESPEADKIDQRVYFVEARHKRDLLEYLLADEEITRVLVFTRTKDGADRVTMHLRHSKIRAEAIHSDKSQPQREQALADFRRGKTRVLVASDIAARGLDVDDISHVINFDLPEEAEVYIHRIGRTARAGGSGVAWSFCGIDERNLLEDIEKLLKRSIPSVDEHPFPSPLPRTLGPPTKPEVSSTWRRPLLRRGRRRL